MRSVSRLDLLAKPAAHLGGRIAERQAVNVKWPVDLVKQVVAAAIGEPGIHLAGVEAEGNGRSERKRQILADVIVGGAISHLDSTVLYRVENLKGRHDFTRTEDADLEFLLGEIGDRLGEQLACAIERIECLWKRGRKPPSQGGSGLRDGGRGDSRSGSGKSNAPEKFPAIHDRPPLKLGSSIEAHRVSSLTRAPISFLPLLKPKGNRALCWQP